MLLLLLVVFLNSFRR